MNKERRKTIKALMPKIGQLESLARDILEDVKCICYDEQEAYDNYPENFQESSNQGIKMARAIEWLEFAQTDLDNVIDCSYDLNLDLNEAMQ